MGYWAYDGTGNQWFVPTEGDPGYVAPVAPPSIPVIQGLSSYDSFNLGADNWIRGSDGNYYKQTGPTYNMEGILQSAMGMDSTPYTAQQLQAMGATQRTINPEYNVDDGTLTGLLGAASLFGGLGAFGGLGGLFGGSEAATAGLADAGYVDTLGGMFGGNVGASAGSVLPSMGLDDLAVSSLSGAPASRGLSWLGNSGLATIPEAVGSLPAAGSAAGGMLSAGTFNPGAVMDAAAAQNTAAGNTLWSTLSGVNPSVLATGANILGGLLQGSSNEEANRQSADATIRAAQIAADAAKFRPIGVKTRFGESQFQKDANGNVIGAGYALTPDVKAMQDSLLGAAPGMLNQFTNSVTTTAPMGTAAQRAMSLGNQYLATDPLAQAQKYYNDQQAVMATQRARDEAGMLTGEFNRGTYGLATGATGQMGAANPRLEALYNAQRQQDLGLAAAATQGGMDYAKFGSGMVGTGGDLLKGMYGTQTAAYAPFQTAMGGANMLEGLGQNALTLGMDLGRQTSNAAAGGLLAQGMANAIPYQQAATQNNPWASILGGGANALNNWQAQQQQMQQNQMLANAIRGNKSSFSDDSYGGTWY